ncbi:MAG TPA: sulfatase-like hydrolase/transferase [Acidimicrobiales bacterium]|nr:sulfatase-like hydrolase/transferase [Acidimicrobiales bacterium]
MTTQPNVLFIITDQERHWEWIPADLRSRLPHRQRLVDASVELTRHYTHSSPCSPSRATLVTGQYVPEHGVTDNVFVDPAHPDLHDAIPTVGHLLRNSGYRTAYVGKWHLSYGNPRMERYGFGDWEGEDWAWTGLAGTGTHFDPLIAGQAASWLREHGRSSSPWFLTVGLVNPHDIHWYPADQPWYQDAHREEIAAVNEMLAPPIPGQPGVAPYTGTYEEHFDLPVNFEDPLDAKPAVHKQWRFEELHSIFGHLDYADDRSWRRGLDYYFRLHELSDVQLGIILAALDDIDRWDDTVVVFTSDHGDMCGSHGLVNKGPFAYEEIMHVPLSVRIPQVSAAGTKTDALTSSADIAPTICELAGVSDRSSSSGVSLVPLVTGAQGSVRDHVLFAQAQAWYRSCVAHRFALRGVFDGRFKYVRYYGVGGGVDSVGHGLPWAREMTVGPDADPWDQEHELYDLQEDPGELVNLAADVGRRKEVRDRFEHLSQLERSAFTHRRPSGAGAGSSHQAGMMTRAEEFRAGGNSEGEG